MKNAISPEWNPMQVFVWTTKQLQAWYDFHGPSALRCGTLWAPESRLLCPNRYEVKFREVVPVMRERSRDGELKLG